MATLNSSPFATDNNSAPSANNKSDSVSPSSIGQDQFAIHTMQDDLNSASSQTLKTPANLPVNTPPFGESDFKNNSIPQQPKNVEPKPFSTSPAAVSSATTHSSASNLDSKISSSPFNNVVEVKEQKNNNFDVTTHKSASIRIIVTIIVILVIGIIGLGSYYFFLIKKPSSNNTANETPAAQTPTPSSSLPDSSENSENKPIAETPIEKRANYSKNTFNYLPLDINTLSQSEIKSRFIEISENLKDSNPGDLYGFFIVDTNNNPISFPIFATAAGLNLSPELLKVLEGDFSFYFYNDNSKIRVAIDAYASQPSVVATELRKQEKTLVKDADFLFLDDKPEIVTGTFSDGSLGNRYANVNTAKDLSIDYGILESKLLIATSKNTMSVIIDKARANAKTF